MCWRPKINTVYFVEYAGHACKLAKEIELGKYDGIIIVSGDGLVHEVSLQDISF